MKSENELEEQIRHYKDNHYGNLISFQIVPRKEDGTIAYLDYNSMIETHGKIIYFKLQSVGEIKITDNGFVGTPREELNEIILSAKKLINCGKRR